MPLKNKEEKKKYDQNYKKTWNLKNKEKIREYTREYHRKHPDRVIEYRRRAAIWRKGNPEKVKEYTARANRKNNLKKKYSITEDDYQKMLEKQNGLCAICGGRGKKKLSVDHCHVTKKVRGLLCQRCNVGIGMFKDDTNFMNKAIEYLKSSGL